MGSAYKAIDLCRRLVDAGAHVAPVLTPDALRFVGALTFSALASEPARTSLFDSPEPIPHTRLGQSADLVIVAPATAKLLGKYAAGISDDLLTATLLATRAPVLVAPAMHTEMWEHPAVRENIATLRRRGVHVVDPERGRLAGGDEGEGRLAGTDTIVRAAAAALTAGHDFAGVRVLVTAGRHPRAHRRGAGDHQPLVGQAGVRRRRGRGPARCRGHARHHHRPARARGRRDRVGADRGGDAGRRAVPRRGKRRHRDGRRGGRLPPKEPPDRKLKKHEGIPEIVLEPTHDFLVDLGRDKAPGQVLVGFAAETDDLVDNAASKLRTKRLDLIVGNDISQPDAGFEVDTNRAVILDADGGMDTLLLQPRSLHEGVILDRGRRFVVERYLRREKAGS